MSRMVIVSLMFMFLSGCASLPDRELRLDEIYNVGTSGDSKLDGTTYIRVSNMKCSNSIVLDLYQDAANRRTGTVVLKAGSTSILDIGKSLQLKINNKAYSFESRDEATEHDKLSFGNTVTLPYSYKTYILPEGVVREAASSNMLLVKLGLLNNTSTVGECSTTTLEQSKDEDKRNYYDDKEPVDAENKFAAVNGFQQFVTLIDLTFGNLGVR
ncbi:MAG TPA: hypothetical protein DCZ75_11225 [Geobacter sp.]|nr:hypothetical protein [Geobacter sp.]